LQVSGLLLAEEPDTAPAQQSDNTKVNQRDRSNAEPTADQQKEKRSDRELARQIRRAPVFRQLSALVPHRALFSGRAKSRHGHRFIHQTMSFMDGELHFSVGVMRTKRIKLG